MKPNGHPAEAKVDQSGVGFELKELQHVLSLIDRAPIRGIEAEAVVQLKMKIRAIIAANFPKKVPSPDSPAPTSPLDDRLPS